MNKQELGHLEAAFKIVHDAINLAMQGKYPLGMDAVKVNSMVYEALTKVSKALSTLVPPELKEEAPKEGE